MENLESLFLQISEEGNISPFDLERSSQGVYFPVKSGEIFKLVHYPVEEISDKNIASLTNKTLRGNFELIQWGSGQYRYNSSSVGGVLTLIPFNPKSEFVVGVLEEHMERMGETGNGHFPKYDICVKGAA